MVHLIPTNRQKFKSAIRWTTEAEQDLKACFDFTDWTVFEAAANDLDELTETVTSYISFYEDMCIPTRTRLTYNNDKPWFTAKLRQLRQAKEDAYRKGNIVLYKQAKYTLRITGAVRSASNAPPSSRTKKITGLNDYRPVDLMSVVMKSFERLVLAYLMASTGPLLDPLQFAYRANRSVDDAVNMGLHFILQHLDRPATYVRILFVDFSSSFNTIIPDTLQNKLTQLSAPPPSVSGSPAS